MTGTITRLVDSRQVGSIAAADGHEYGFAAIALRGTEFSQLSIGAAVNFTPAHTSNARRAEVVLTVR